MGSLYVRVGWWNSNVETFFNLFNGTLLNAGHGALGPCFKGFRYASMNEGCLGLGENGKKLCKDFGIWEWWECQ